VRPRVGVIDSSASVRETIAIVLDDCDVSTAASEALLRGPGRQAFDVLIVEEGLVAAPHLHDIAAGTPLLWLCDPRQPRWRNRQQASLPRRFTPSGLRQEVQRLLLLKGEPSAEDQNDTTLCPPTLPIETAQLARAAALTPLPVLLYGEPGTGKLRVARGIHARSGMSRLTILAAVDVDHRLPDRLAALGSQPSTLFVNDVDQVSPDGQQALLDLLEAGGAGAGSTWQPVRLLCASSHSIEQMEEMARLDRELLYRLAVLPIRLPALRDRTAELPSIINMVAEQLAQRMNLTAPRFTPSAIERLTHYLWFGNLAELESVLARTLALTDRRPLDAGDLQFGYPRLAQAPDGPLPVACAAGNASRAAPVVPASVDVLINELAHEFKNPMVTIKTISGHLERLLADEEGRQHVAQLAGEAIDRMDRVLENLLQFTRFQAPQPTAVGLNGLLAPCLAELGPLLTERRIVLDYQPPRLSEAHVDGEQIIYALGNLLRTVVRDLEEGCVLKIRAGEPGPALEIESPAATAAVSERLSHYSDAPAPAAPLGLLFARALIERNDGELTIAVHDGVQRIAIRLPRYEGNELAHGKA
jgi:DNA-binding NtrC family response regulator